MSVNIQTNQMKYKSHRKISTITIYLITHHMAIEVEVVVSEQIENKGEVITKEVEVVFNKYIRRNKLVVQRVQVRNRPTKKSNKILWIC